LRQLCVVGPGVLLAGRVMATILSRVHLGTENLHFEWKGNVLCSPEKSRGEGSSKQQKTMELPPSDGESVLDVLAALLEEVKWLQGGETAGQGDLLRI